MATKNIKINDNIYFTDFKEIEYSEANLALLAEMFWEKGFEKIAVCL